MAKAGHQLRPVLPRLVWSWVGNLTWSVGSTLVNLNQGKVEPETLGNIFYSCVSLLYCFVNIIATNVAKRCIKTSSEKDLVSYL